MHGLKYILSRATDWGGWGEVNVKYIVRSATGLGKSTNIILSNCVENP